MWDARGLTLTGLGVRLMPLPCVRGVGMFSRKWIDGYYNWFWCIKSTRLLYMRVLAN